MALLSSIREYDTALLCAIKPIAERRCGLIVSGLDTWLQNTRALVVCSHRHRVLCGWSEHILLFHTRVFSRSVVFSRRFDYTLKHPLLVRIMCADYHFLIDSNTARFVWQMHSIVQSRTST